MTPVETPSPAGCTGTIRPVCTWSASPPRRISTAGFDTRSRPRYAVTFPDAATS